jgi:hypothetical protein
MKSNPTHKKNLILDSFCKMNIGMLSVLLDDDKTYDDAEKEVFLAKMEIIFEQFRNDGDSELIPSRGNCGSKKCSSAGCSGYAFEGNLSGMFMALIFKETEEDVTDIFQCSQFETPTEIGDEQLTYYIQEDERTDFTPPLDYWTKRQRCQEAFDELNAFKNEVLHKDIYLPWLRKYASLYKATSGLENRYAAYDVFHSLYFNFKELAEFLELSASTEQAVEEFRVLQYEDEVLLWLSKYETLGTQLTFFSSLRYENDTDDIIIPFTVDSFTIDPIDFLYLYRFTFLFDHNYYPMLDKYITYSTAEIEEFYNNDEHHPTHIYSLSYHLRRRGILPK